MLGLLSGLCLCRFCGERDSLGLTVSYLQVWLLAQWPGGHWGYTGGWWDPICLRFSSRHRLSIAVDWHHFSDSKLFTSRVTHKSYSLAFYKWTEQLKKPTNIYQMRYLVECDKAQHWTRRRRLLHLLNRSSLQHCLSPVHETYVLERKLLFDLHRVTFLSGNHVSLGGDQSLSVEPAQRLELEGAAPQPLTTINVSPYAVPQSKGVMPRGPGIFALLVFASQEVHKPISFFWALELVTTVLILEILEDDSSLGSQGQTYY